MRIAFIATGSLLLLGVAACSPGYQGTTATGGTPMGAGTTSPRSSSQMPQSPNSLPQGAAVNAPLTTNTGRVGTTAY